MTIRKTHTAAGRGLALSTLVIGLAGCNTIGSFIEGDKLDYRDAKKASALDIPPDLTQLQKDGRYAIPDNGKGIATLAGYQQQRSANGTGAAIVAGGATVGPVASKGMHIERAGDKRWLVVNQTPEALWAQLKEFWHDAGFTIISENATTGTMETDWTENRAKIPQDIIRSAIGKVFDGLYSSGERDKFRTRIERNADGSTEIFISHRGVQEVLVGSQKDQTQWTFRPNDPDLEAQMLARMMSRLGGGDKKETLAAVTAAQPQAEHSKIVGGTIEVDEGFDRAWRRVGQALDRSGFTVEDRDRNKGIFFVRYIDPDTKAPGFFSKLFSFGSSADAEKDAQRYRVVVKAAADGKTSVVAVLPHDEKVAPPETGKRILALLQDQLK